jgi:hypothetical protein
MSTLEERQRLNAFVLSYFERHWTKSRASDVVRDAIWACHEFEIVPPLWLVQATTEALSGRHRPHAARKRDWIHGYRWMIVGELLQMQYESGDRRSKARAYREAADFLEGTEAAGDPETIRSSYNRVDKDRAEGEGATYYPFRSVK